MLAPKAFSRRAPIEGGPAREILDTDYDGKRLRVWITLKAGLQPGPGELGETDRVHLAVLVNHHQVTRSIGDILKKALSGDAVVVVCQTQKAYQSSLSFLGYSRTATACGESSGKA